MSARKNLISGLMMLFVTTIFFVAVFDIEEDPFGHGMDPDTFPLAVALALMALSIGYVIFSAFAVRKEGKEPGPTSELVIFGTKIASLPHDLYLFVAWVLPMSAIAFAYLGLMNLFQYLLPSIICLSACLALFGNRGVKLLLTIPIFVMLAYYIIFFGIFRLSEPRGVLLEYDNYYIFGPLQKMLGV
ncbi:MAG: hypothetical protein O2912_01455 [Proteobacteria bacterium]|nr:hypothetical protein [Pseudomonadota bacterium]